MNENSNDDQGKIKTVQEELKKVKQTEKNMSLLKNKLFISDTDSLI